MIIDTIVTQAVEYKESYVINRDGLIGVFVKMKALKISYSDVSCLIHELLIQQYLLKKNILSNHIRKLLLKIIKIWFSFVFGKNQYCENHRKNKRFSNRKYTDWHI